MPKTLTVEGMISILSNLPPKRELYCLREDKGKEKIFSPMTAGYDMILSDVLYIGDRIVPEKHRSNAGSLCKAEELNMREEKIA